MADDPHSHSHSHAHGSGEVSELSDLQLRVRALETILTEKGYIDPAALDAIVEACETQIGPHNGARIVARAWTDPEFKKRLLEDASEAANSLGHVSPVGAHLIALENTPDQHNLVVCTLCSCYPWPVLGLPPTWYKSPPYRARMVREPRVLLREMGLDLPESVEIRVWDSSAEIRYMVLPERPAGSEDRSEEELAALVTRDAMIGTARP
jgi:nitrile hydratase